MIYPLIELSNWRRVLSLGAEEISEAIKTEVALVGASKEALIADGALVESKSIHPLLGARLADGSPDWRNLIDPVRVPYLADHQVAGAVVAPASALIEMALAVGREVYGETALELDEFDVLRPLTLSDDKPRETSTRHLSHTGVVEIWSRACFLADAWILHARGYLKKLITEADQSLTWPDLEQVFHHDADEVYAEARRAGLGYGPLFQLIEHVERDDVAGRSTMRAATGGLGAFTDVHVLHPASLDASLHGLFVARPQRDGEMKAHLPIRFRKIRVWRQGAPVRTAMTRLIAERARSKAVAVSLLDADGAMVASVETVVLRSVYLYKPLVDNRTLRSVLSELTPLSNAGARRFVVRDLTKRLREPPPQVLTLVCAFCRSLSQAVLRDVFDEMNAASLDEVKARLRQFPEAQAFFRGLLEVAADTGALPSGGVGVRVIADPELATPDVILATLMSHCPDASLEIFLCATLMSNARRVLRGEPLLEATPGLSRRFGAHLLFSRQVDEALTSSLSKLQRQSGRTWRVLVLAPLNRGILRRLAPCAKNGFLDITIASTSRGDLDHARQEIGALFDAGYLLLGDDRRTIGVFDAIAGEVPRAQPHDWLAMLRAAISVAPHATVLLKHVRPSAQVRLLFGVWSRSPGNPWADEHALTEADLMAALTGCGVIDVTVASCNKGEGELIVGLAQPTSVVSFPSPNVCIASGSNLLIDLGLAGADVIAPSKIELHGLSQEVRSAATMWVLPETKTSGDRERLALRVETLREVLQAHDEAKATGTLVVVTRGALSGAGEDASVERAIYGFTRVAMNEYPSLDIRLMDCEEGASVDLPAALRAAGQEREIFVGAAGVSVNRIVPGMAFEGLLGQGERAVLKFSQPGKLDEFAWRRAPRLRPQPGEVEIAVCATGLNDRDVLLAQGVVDDDLLSAGFTKAALGFECSGVVTRVGRGVTRLKVGDRVMGFAPDAFASHVLAPDWHFVTVPDNVSLESAAALPVAFATAWLGLIHRARLSVSSDVLIHGAAGGVGLAATQIAKMTGARVLATASTSARRLIARMYGADATFDSRGERFVEPIKRQFGGVDVVINSIAGTGMLAGLDLVKPFGCFIELGKHDYLENTSLSLRPFVRNLTYSGFDLDEWLAHNPRAIKETMAEIGEAFAKGQLSPLPYQVYEASEVADAFRAMRANEHIGKIVVKPSCSASYDYSGLTYRALAGAYLVVGGTHGFGFATAQWLARQGATTLILASRRGEVAPELRGEIERLSAAGVEVLQERLDVTDAGQVRALVERLTPKYGPLRGVVHAAVQIDDGLISALEPSRLRASLAAKVDGVINLDAATRDQPLEFFVMYSSATTLLGSPGQSAYVAANAYLEGFARRRRRQGRPGLAIAWGAIADVGVIAPDKMLAQRLRQTAGVLPILAGEALAHLGRLLAMGDLAQPVEYYTNIAPTAAARKLALLNSPTFAPLDLARTVDEADGGTLLDLLSGKGDARPLRWSEAHCGGRPCTS